MEFVVAALGSWVESVHVFTDNEICLAWVSYESVKLSTFERNRVFNITSKVPLDTIMHVQGKVNPCGCGNWTGYYHCKGYNSRFSMVGRLPVDEEAAGASKG